VTDAELVERAQSGDAGAFGTLVERHRAAVYRAALAVLGSAPDAEDVAQEALVTAYQKLGGFRGDAAFKTWVLTITWRQALDRRRTIAMRLKRFVTPDDEAFPDAIEPGPGPDAALVGTEFRGQVRRLVTRLPTKLRDPLLLWASGDYSYDEMARVLGIPSGTAKWRVMEARRQLREKLLRLGYVAS
jgi:RNA polymerase sigma-70 factor (ECF subfamily)